MKKRWLLSVFASFMLLASPFTNDAEAASNKELTSTANKYIGVPYSYGGTTSNGFDCSGYTQKVFSELGISIGRTTSAQYSTGTAVSKSDLKVGDLVFFNTSGKGVSHVGIFVGNGEFIHSSSSKGVTVSKLSESYWATRYLGAKQVASFQSQEAVAKVVKKEEVKSAAIDFSIYASRAEVAKQLAQALNLDTSNTNSTFTDVKSTDSYAGAVAALQQKGIFQGDGNNKFNPNSPITRAEMSKVLVVAFNLKLQDSSVSFTDVPSSNWAYQYVNNLASNKVTLGLGNGTFGAKDNVSLTQLQLFIERSMN